MDSSYYSASDRDWRFYLQEDQPVHVTERISPMNNSSIHVSTQPGGQVRITEESRAYPQQQPQAKTTRAQMLRAAKIQEEQERLQKNKLGVGGRKKRLSSHSTSTHSTTSHQQRKHSYPPAAKDTRRTPQQVKHQHGGGGRFSPNNTSSSSGIHSSHLLSNGASVLNTTNITTKPHRDHQSPYYDNNDEFGVGSQHHHHHIPAAGSSSSSFSTMGGYSSSNNHNNQQPSSSSHNIHHSHAPLHSDYNLYGTTTAASNRQNNTNRWDAIADDVSSLHAPSTSPLVTTQAAGGRTTPPGAGVVGAAHPSSSSSSSDSILISTQDHSSSHLHDTMYEKPQIESAVARVKNLMAFNDTGSVMTGGGNDDKVNVLQLEVHRLQGELANCKSAQENDRLIWEKDRAWGGEAEELIQSMRKLLAQKDEQIQQLNKLCSHQKEQISLLHASFPDDGYQDLDGILHLNKAETRHRHGLAGN